MSRSGSRVTSGQYSVDKFRFGAFGPQADLFEDDSITDHLMFGHKLSVFRLGMFT